MNNCVLIGRIKEVPEVTKTSKGNTVAHMILETDRNFRNEDGTMSTDQFRITVWKGAAEECASLCKPGDTIAIKGRLQGNKYIKDGKTYYNQEVIAEYIDYLSHRIANSSARV